MMRSKTNWTRSWVLTLAVTAAACANGDPKTVTPGVSNALASAAQCTTRGLSAPSAADLGSRDYANLAKACTGIAGASDSTNAQSATAAFNAGMIYNALGNAAGSTDNYNLALKALATSYQDLADSADNDSAFKFGRLSARAKALVALGQIEGATVLRECGTRAVCLTEAATLLDGAEISYALPLAQSSNANSRHAYYEFVMLRAAANKQLVELGYGEKGGKAIQDFKTVVSGQSSLTAQAQAELIDLTLDLGKGALQQNPMSTQSLGRAIGYYDEAVGAMALMSNVESSQNAAYQGSGDAYFKRAQLSAGADKQSDYCRASSNYDLAGRVAASKALVPEEIAARSGRGKSLAALILAGAGSCVPADPSQPQSVQTRRNAAIADYERTRELRTSRDSTDLAALAKLYQDNGQSGLAAKIIAELGASGMAGQNGLMVMLSQAELAAEGSVDRLNLLNQAARAYPQSPLPNLKIGKYHYGKEALALAASALQQADAKSQNLSQYATERAEILHYRSQIGTQQAAKGGRKTSLETVQWAEQATALDAKSAYRQQACRAYLMHDGDASSRAQAAIRCARTETAEDALLNAMFLLRQGQRFEPRSQTLQAFGPAQIAFENAERQLADGSAWFQWPGMNGDLTFSRALAYGKAISNSCSRQAGQSVTPPSDPDGKSRAFFTMYGVFKCSP